MRRRSGFTLIEILAVVAIFALLTALIAPNLGSLSSRTLRQRAESIAASLELARQRSVLTGIPHRLLIDLDQSAYRLEWFVTEVEAGGEAAESEPEPLDVRGQSPIPMAAPRGETRAYRPLPGLRGHFERLEDSVRHDHECKTHRQLDGGVGYLAPRGRTCLGCFLGSWFIHAIPPQYLQVDYSFESNHKPNHGDPGLTIRRRRSL